MTAEGPAAAMVLAAGLGTRMRPLTLSMPKALVPVAGRALVDHALARVAAAGIGRAVVNLHHMADRLEAHLAARRGAPALVLADERARLLDTGGGLLAALPLLGDGPVLALNSDAIFAGPDPLAPLIGAWQATEGAADVVMLLAARAQCRGYTRAGDFFLDADGGIPARRGEAATAPYVFTGAQILTAAAFEGLGRRTGEAFSMNLAWDAALARGRLRAALWDPGPHGAWVDVGTPAGIAEAEAALDAFAAAAPA